MKTYIYSLPKIFASATGQIETSWTISTGRTRHDGVVDWGLPSLKECLSTIDFLTEQAMETTEPYDYVEEGYGCYQIDEATGEGLQCVDVSVCIRCLPFVKEKPYLQSEFV